MMEFQGFQILPLTSDDDCNYSNIDEPDDSDMICNWMDDSECQENLFTILSLTPEESTIDENNHIHFDVKLFFEELGYLTEEPEPIDPTRDYDEEARQLLEERGRTRQKHVDVSTRPPSLSHSSRSGLSSTTSSCHHHNHHYQDHDHDIRSPFFMGQVGLNQDFYYSNNNSHPSSVPSLYIPTKTGLVHEPLGLLMSQHEFIPLT